jgi:hypothetical protein
MTPSEVTLVAALLSAVISAIVSVLTTRYVVRHGPNYGERIDKLSGTIAELANTQEELRKQQAQEAMDESERHAAMERKAEAARWKPAATIESTLEGQQYVNRLLLKSAQEFRVLEVGLLAPGGAKLHDFPQQENWVSSKGFAITISQDVLNKSVDISPTFFMQETFGGSLRYRVERNGAEPVYFTGEIPFHGKRAYVQNTCSYRLSG